MVEIPVLSLKAGDQCPRSRWSGKERKTCSYSAFYSIQVFKGLDGAHPHWEGQFALLSLQIQMCVSYENILIHTPRIMFNQYLGTLWPSRVGTHI